MDSRLSEFDKIFKTITDVYVQKCATDKLTNSSGSPDKSTKNDKKLFLQVLSQASMLLLFLH